MAFSKNLASLFFLIFIVLLSGCSSTLPGKILVGHESPTLRLYRLEDGSAVTMSSYPGQRKILLFWNTQCGASKRAMEKLDRIAQRYLARKDASTVFIAANLNSSDDLKKVKDEIIERDAYSLEHMMSGNEEYDQAYLRVMGDQLPYIVAVESDDTLSVVADNLDFLE